MIETTDIAELKDAIVVNPADLEIFEPLRDGLINIGVHLITSNMIERGKFIAIGELSDALVKELGKESV